MELKTHPCERAHPRRPRSSPGIQPPLSRARSPSAISADDRSRATLSDKVDRMTGESDQRRGCGRECGKQRGERLRERMVRNFSSDKRQQNFRRKMKKKEGKPRIFGYSSSSLSRPLWFVGIYIIYEITNMRLYTEDFLSRDSPNAPQARGSARVGDNHSQTRVHPFTHAYT